jgi:hypothetical protein
MENPPKAEEDATCIVTERWLNMVVNERDRLEHENIQLVDKLGAMRLQLEQAQFMLEKVCPANAKLVQRYKENSAKLSQKRQEVRRMRRVSAVHLFDEMDAAAAAASASRTTTSSSSQPAKK